MHLGKTQIQMWKCLNKERETEVPTAANWIMSRINVCIIAITQLPKYGNLFRKFTYRTRKTKYAYPEFECLMCPFIFRTKTANFQNDDDSLN